MSFFSNDDNAKQKRPKGNRKAVRRARVTPVRQNVVDKKADTPKLRQELKERRLRQNLKIVGFAALGMALLALGNAALQENLFQNPRFSLRQVFVETEGMLSPQQITRATGLKEGENLLTVNLRDVRERLERLPAIRSAVVQRDFDGRLTVKVQQRKPVAWVKCERLHWIPKRVGQSLVADAEGIAIPVETITSELDALPVIADESIDQIALGAPIIAARFIASLKLLSMLRLREESGGEKLAGISVPNKFALVASFASGARVTFAYDDVEPQIRRYDQFYAAARQKKWDIDTLNLVAEHNTPATFRVTALAEPPAAIPVVARADSPRPRSSTPASTVTRSSASASRSNANATTSRSTPVSARSTKTSSRSTPKSRNSKN